MKKVILVDDEKLVAEAIRRQVDWESCGAVLCRVCLNAFEALKAVEEVRPDIIITDIKMPVMDGLELVRRVRESDPYPEFIILSGYGEFELAKQAMKEGVKQFLLKPCSEEDIRRAIQSARRFPDWHFLFPAPAVRFVWRVGYPVVGGFFPGAPACCGKRADGYFPGLRRRAAHLYSCGCAHRTGGRRLLCPAAGRREKRAGKRE